MDFVRKGPFLPLVLLVTAILVSYHINGCNGQRYQATVFEFRPEAPAQGQNLRRDQALRIMEKNIDIYKMQARIAGERRIDIIVFPEYGLFGIFGYARYARRSDIYPFLETIPDPGRMTWNPCTDRKRINDTEIQKYLSCMAKDNDIYLVANVGEKVACKKSDRGCPEDGRYQYNTNVVYSSNGTLVAKYRKKHLFKEPHYNSPDKTEIVIFNTHFGKFGLTTSYDSLFKSPILDLVRRKVRDIVMPNAWMTSKPLFRGIQWHSSLAQGLEINLIVSTVHDGISKSYGSGIYARDGAKSYFSEPDNYGERSIPEKLRHLAYFSPRPQKPIIPRWSISRTKTTNHSMSFLDYNLTFKSIELTKSSDDLTVCHGRFCCRLSYSVENGGRIEKYALAVYKGPVRTLGYLLEVEMCAVLRCFPKCGGPIQRANTYFEKFYLAGVNFSTPYIYPQVLTLSGHQPVLATHQWEYEHGQITFRAPENPLHSASLIGRVYDKDIKDDRRAANRGISGHNKYSNYAPAKYASNIILSVIFSASIVFLS